MELEGFWRCVRVVETEHRVLVDAALWFHEIGRNLTTFGRDLYVAALAHSAAHGSGGFVHADHARLLSVSPRPKATIDLLVTLGLWRELPERNGFCIEGWGLMVTNGEDPWRGGRRRGFEAVVRAARGRFSAAQSTSSPPLLRSESTAPAVGIHRSCGDKSTAPAVTSPPLLRSESTAPAVDNGDAARLEEPVIPVVSETAGRVAKAVKAKTGLQVVVEYWAELFEKSKQTKPVIQWGKYGKQLKPVLDVHGVDGTKAMLDRFFDSTDAWVMETDYGIGAFVSRANKLAAEARNGAEPRSVLSTPKTAGNRAAFDAFIRRGKMPKSEGEQA